MERDKKTYAQDMQTKQFEYFGREIQVAAKRKKLHTRCSHYPKKKNGTHIKERTQTAAAAKKT
jgi:hypothetical protein